MISYHASGVAGKGGYHIVDEIACGTCMDGDNGGDTVIVQAIQLHVVCLCL